MRGAGRSLDLHIMALTGTQLSQNGLHQQWCLNDAESERAVGRELH